MESVDGLRAGTTNSVAPFLMARSIASMLGFRLDDVELVELLPWGITVHTKNGNRSHFAGKLYG